MLSRIPSILVASVVLTMSFFMQDGINSVAAQGKKPEPRLGIYKLSSYSTPPFVAGKTVPIVNETPNGELELLPNRQYKVWTSSGKAGGNLMGEGTYDINAYGNVVWKTGYWKDNYPASFNVIGTVHQLQLSPKRYAINHAK